MNPKQCLIRQWDKTLISFIRAPYLLFKYCDDLMACILRFPPRACAVLLLVDKTGTTKPVTKRICNVHFISSEPPKGFSIVPFLKIEDCS